MKNRRNSHFSILISNTLRYIADLVLNSTVSSQIVVCAVIDRRDNWCFVELTKILKNYLALPKSSQRTAAEQLNISLDKMHEFEKLN